MSKKIVLEIDCCIEFCATPDCECRFQTPQKYAMYCELFHKPLQVGHNGRMKSRYTDRLPECIAAEVSKT